MSNCSLRVPGTLSSKFLSCTVAVCQDQRYSMKDQRITLHKRCQNQRYNIPLHVRSISCTTRVYILQYLGLNSQSLMFTLQPLKVKVAPGFCLLIRAGGQIFGFGMGSQFSLFSDSSQQSFLEGPGQSMGSDISSF